MMNETYNPEIKNEAAPTKLGTFREKITQFEDMMGQLPQVERGDECGELKHHFGDGLYVRELIAPAGYLIVTKIHKLTHPVFVMTGEVSVLTEEGVKRFKAPYWMMTPAGTKRICYVHSESIWITVHPNPEDTQDMDEIEMKVIAKDFEDATLLQADINKLLKEV